MAASGNFWPQLRSRRTNQSIWRTYKCILFTREDESEREGGGGKEKE